MLLLTDKIRLGAWVFYIRKLKPSYFLANDSFPLNNFIKYTDKNEIKIDSNINTDAINKAFKETLSKGIIKGRRWFKTYSNEDCLEIILQNEELKAYLFAEIVRISFNIKKKTKLLHNSMKPTHTKFIG